jgi:hypothetical protein
MQNHEQKKKVKKSEKPRFCGQNKLIFEHPALQPLGSFMQLLHAALGLHVGATKIRHGLIQSRNWTGLVFTESL